MRRHLWWRIGAGLLSFVLACAAEDEPSGLDRTGSRGDMVEVQLEASASTPAAGTLLAVAIRATSPTSARLGALQGTLRFDPGSLTYLGQADAGQGYTAVNPAYSEAGLLFLASFDPAGLPPRTSILIFRAHRGEVLSSLRYSVQVAGSTDLAVLRPVRLVGTTVAGDLVPSPILGPKEAMARVRAQYAGKQLSAIKASAGNAIYGDVTFDLVVNVNDAVAVAGASVGARSILADAFIAGNVAPANLPGLGEPGDAPPGDEPDGEASLDVLDALAVARISVGIPAPIVGQPIPMARLGQRVIVTPNPVRASAMTDGCKARIEQSGQWDNAAAGKPWPECVAEDGKPMVIQFCAYAKVAPGEWLPSTDTSKAARCVAELPVVQAGGL